MYKSKKKIYLQQKKRFLNKIVGTNLKPRLSIFKSYNHMYVQIIDDTCSKTLISSSTLILNLKKKNILLSKINIAILLGKDIAKKALSINIKNVILDCKNKRYSGCIKYFANSARINGLFF